MLEKALIAGISITEFWEMTPAELLICVKVYSSQAEAKRKQQTLEQYQLAVMISRFVWAKKIPRYEELFPPEEKEPTEEEFFAYIQGVNRTFGGVEE